MSQTPAAPPTAPSEKIDTEIHCLRCEYNLEGLDLFGVCPECGTHIAESHRGTLLKNTSPEYLETLHKGVFKILAAIVTILVGTTASVITLATGAPLVVPIGLAVTVVAAFGVAAFGWWQFSEPAPDYAGKNTGEQARLFVRIALGIVIAMQCFSWGVIIYDVIDMQSQPNDGLLFMAGRFIGAVGVAVFYTASMVYVRWIGARIPSKKVVDRGNLLVWAGPILVLGGVIFALLSLIALVLYWNLLDWVRKDLKAIRGV